MVYTLSSVSLLFIFTLVLLLPAYLCRLSKEFRACRQSFNCGNVTNIGYPFYGLNRPSYCGHPGFELTNCAQTAEPIGMMIQSHEFIVVGINMASSTINVSRKDYYTRSGCPSISLDNITIDFSLFNYTPLDANLTLVYGDCASRCNTSWWFNCPMNPTTKVPFCFLTKNAMLSSNISEKFCPNHLFMPIHLSEYLALDVAGGYSPTVAWNGFELQWKANNGLCNQCLRSGGQCGHEPRSNKFFCFCTDESKCPFPGSTPYKATLTKTNIALIACFSAIGVGFLIVLVLFVKRRCSSKEDSEQKRKPDVEAFLRNHGSVSLQRYTYSDLKRITGSFKEKLGEGGYGVVFKGKFPNFEQVVAVKMLKKPEVNAEEFINEVASIGNTNHVNVVSLRGFCYEGRHRALVYDYMLNGSLEKYIYERSNNERLLSWEELFQIAVGIARGLEYLHRGCNTRILHFDIKPHNILLDENFCPKISDFGLAKLCPQKETIVSLSGARGTVGYIAPEVFLRSFGGVSYKSDVYSYGMLVLEIVGCRRNAKIEDDSAEKYFPQWIYEQLEVGEGFDDGQEMLTFEELEIQKKMIMVSLMCVKTNPSSRPEMSRVVELLEGSIESLQIPRISSLGPSASVIGSSSHEPSSSQFSHTGSLSSQPWQSSNSSTTPTL